MSRKIEAVIFDMDGLMFDTETLCTRCMIEASKRQGVVMTPEETHLVLGFKSEDIYDFYEEYYRGKMDGRKMIDDHYDLMHEVLFTTGPDKMPYLVEILDYLKEKGYKLAVASSSVKKHIINNMEKNNVEGYFDVVASGQEVENGKPAPDVFLLAAERLGVDPSKCMVLEDSSNGVRAAKAAGMYNVMIPDAYQPDDELRKEAYAVVENLWKVKDLLETM